jgi:hypothetical protein
VALPASLRNMEQMVFSGCTALTTLTLPDSPIPIGVYTFERCLQTLLVSPSSIPTPPPPSDPPGSPPPCPIWETLWEHLPHIVRVHAPNHIIAQLYVEESFPCTTMAAVPGPDRITPPGTSYARGELNLWWTPTFPANRQPSVARHGVVRTVLTVAERLKTEDGQLAVEGTLLEVLPIEIWLMVLGLVKHDQHMSYPEFDF